MRQALFLACECTLASAHGDLRCVSALVSICCHGDGSADQAAMAAFSYVFRAPCSLAY